MPKNRLYLSIEASVNIAQEGRSSNSSNSNSNSKGSTAELYRFFVPHQSLLNINKKKDEETIQQQEQKRKPLSSPLVDKVTIPPPFFLYPLVSIFDNLLSLGCWIESEFVFRDIIGNAARRYEGSHHWCNSHPIRKWTRYLNYSLLSFLSIHHSSLSVFLVIGSMLSFLLILYLIFHPLFSSSLFCPNCGYWQPSRRVYHPTAKDVGEETVWIGRIPIQRSCPR